MDFKRALLAAGLSIAVLVVWQMVFPPAERPVPDRDTAIEETLEDGAPAAVGVDGSADGAAGDDPGVPVDEAETSGAADAAPEGDSVADADEAPAPERIASNEHTLTLETRTYRAEFTNRGAELVRLELWNHEESNGDLVDLVQARGDGEAYPFGFVNPDDGSAHRLGDALFVGGRAVADDGSEGLLFEYNGPAGRATKRYSLTPDGVIRAEIEAEGAWALRWGPGLRNLPEDAARNRFERRTVLVRRDGNVDRDDVARLDEISRIGSTGLDWIGIDDTYFLSVVLPQEGLREVEVHPMVEQDGALRRIMPGEKVDKKARREAEFVLVPDGEKLRLSAYLGTKEFDRLEQMPRGLVAAADRSSWLGSRIMSGMARGLQIALRWIYANVVQNYGWAIVILTFLVKLALFPLTQKSMVSMARMQEINPKVQAIRTKFRPKLKDKQGRPNAEAQRKMNEEIMGLYKAEGVNPASGCLPVLVQLPIFFALFRLLGSAIELRNAPWIFWIRDLSVADPVYVLPVLMGASQLLQQKMTPMTGDPMQRRLMTFMPIMFVVFAFTFPAGLVLYWLTSNLLTIVQNGLYNRWKKRAGQES